MSMISLSQHLPGEITSTDLSLSFRGTVANHDQLTDNDHIGKKYYIFTYIFTF